MITSFADLLHPHDPNELRAAAASGQRLLLRTDRAGEFAGFMPWERFNDLVTADRVLAGDIEFARNNAILPAEMTIVRPERQKPPTRMRTTALHHYAQQGVSTIINAVERFDPDTGRLNAIVQRAFRARVQLRWPLSNTPDDESGTAANSRTVHAGRQSWTVVAPSAAFSSWSWRIAAARSPVFSQDYPTATKRPFTMAWSPWPTRA